MSLQAGQMLAHYRLVEKAGEGGMGVVWKALDTRLDREVALKILPRDLAADPERLNRFKREARTVASLNHPNIVTIHSVEKADDLRFITMEMVDGERLDALIPHGGMPLKRFFSLALPLVDALCSAHAQGITHRDVKPSNIMVGAGDRPKILDFGLAKLRRDDPVAESTNLPTMDRTQAGRMMGTMPYMSPEQARTESVDERSDIFSLGIIFFELLTGKRPFTGENSADLISSILRDTPESVTSLNPLVPRQLDRIFRRCLEKEPDDRYTTARVLQADLERLRDDIASGDLKPDSAGRLDLGGKRRSWLTVGLVTAAAVLAVLAVLWTGGQLSRHARPLGAAATEQAGLAVLPFVNLSPDPDNEYFSDGMTEELINTMMKVPGVRVSARTSVFALKGMELTVREIGQRLGVRTVLEGSIRRSGNRVRVTAQLIDTVDEFPVWSDSFDREMKDIFSIQEEISQAIVDSLKIRLARGPGQALVDRSTQDLRAYNLYLQGRYQWNKRTQEGLRQAAGNFREAIDFDPGYALAFAGLADTLVLLPLYTDEPAAEILPQARQAALRALELDDTLVEAHTSLGQVLKMSDQDVEAAEGEFRRALELNPDYATTHHWLGLLLLDVPGRAEEGVQHLARARELDPISRVIRLALGTAQLRFGRFGQAVETLEELRAIDPDYPVYGELADAYYGTRRFADAVEAIETMQRAHGLDLSGWNRLVSYHHLLGDHATELEQARRARGSFPGQWMAIRLEAQALAALGRTGEISRLVDEAFGLDDIAGQAREMVTISAELRVHGHPELAARIAQRAADWMESRSPQERLFIRGQESYLAFCLMQTGQIERAREIYATLARDDQKGLQAVETWESVGMSGSLAALAGDVAAAREAELRLSGMGGTGGGDVTYWRAAIAASLGERDRAVSLLSEAFEGGFHNPLDAHVNPLFESLWDYPSYRALLDDLGLPGPSVRQARS